MNKQKMLDSCDRLDTHHKKCCIAYCLLMLDDESNRKWHSEYVAENYTNSFDIVEYCDGVLDCVLGEINEVLKNTRPDFNLGYSNQHALEQAASIRSSHDEPMEDLG